MQLQTQNKVAIVIPYFQRERGILKGTVQSILDQKGFDNFQIIIVDDSSPVSAHDEVSGLQVGHDKITIIVQKNAGPGAARNKGLANLPESTAYVTCMDSDDRWEEYFLRDAVFALNKGYDMFVGNSRRVDVAETRFEWGKAQSTVLDPSLHCIIDLNRNLYEYSGDFFDFLVHRSSVVGPSSMMYRLNVAPSLRYNEAIYNGQDRLFKLLLTENVKKVAFSPNIYAQEGRGINIFDSSQWGSQRSLAFLSSYIDMCKAVLNEVTLNEKQRTFVESALQDTRYSFVATMLHQMRHPTKMKFDVIGETFLKDPASALRLIPNAVQVLITKMKSVRRTSATL